MQDTRRRFGLALGLAFALGTSSAFAQSWPERSIRLIVPFGPGAFPDTVARIVGERMSAGLGQPVVIDNRPGAGGNIGTEAVVKAAPDGYTLLLHSVANATSKGLYPKLAFDPLQDLKPITQLASVGNVIVAAPSLPAATVQDLLALTRKRPDGLLYASGGNGTTSHLAVELLKSATGAPFVHVPYKIFGQALTDVMAGQPDFVAPNIPPTVPTIQAGKFKAIAVTSAKRSPLLPDVPTVAEQGVSGFDVVSWNGLAAPAGTPDAIIQRVHAEAVKALNDPGVRAKLTAQGAELIGSSPAEYTAFVREETGRWTRIIQSAGIQID